MFTFLQAKPPAATKGTFRNQHADSDSKKDDKQAEEKSEIAALKARVAELEDLVRLLTKVGWRCNEGRQ